jgi:hypothetical protein
MAGLTLQVGHRFPGYRNCYTPTGADRGYAQCDVGVQMSRRDASLIVRPLTPTHHALLHSLSTYLTFIKQRLARAVEECVAEDTARWNKWMSALKDVRELAGALCELMNWVSLVSEVNGGTDQFSLCNRTKLYHYHLEPRLSYRTFMPISCPTSRPPRTHSNEARSSSPSHTSSPMLLSRS